ncbi:MAG: tetratricopeptide repeat protein [Candidatus Fermentibacteraceae bacterium]
MPDAENGRIEPAFFEGRSLTPFTDRRTEMDALGSLLLEHELVCVHGPVGIGKSRLCREAGRELSSRFPDGIGYAALESVRSRPRLVSAMAQAAGLSFYSSQGRLEQLAAYLDGRRMLLVCDGIEDFDGLEGLLDALLPSLGRAVVLCNRRPPLSHPRAASLVLAGLECRGSRGQPGPAPHLLQSAFEELHGDPLPDGERAGLEELCRSLRGNPMAMELAAAVLGEVSMAALRSDLSERLATPEGGDGALSHEYVVRAMLEILWSRISREERQATRQLSVFSGVFPLEHARELTGAQPGLLRSLRELGILRPQREDRAYMPGPVRDFAFERLSELEQRLVDARSRHCALYMSFLESQGGEMRSGNRQEAFRRIFRQRRDVRKAWMWALESGRTDLVARGMDGLTGFFEAGSLFFQGVQAFETAVELLRRLHIRRDDLDVEELLAMAQSRLGWFIFHTGDLDRAEEILSRSLFILRHYGNMRETALTLNYLGNVFQYSGRVREAAVRYEEALKLSVAAGDEDGRARTLNNLGIAAAVQGDAERAESCIRRFMQISEDLGDLVNYAKGLGNLGQVCIQTGRFEEAREIFERHLELNRRLGAPLGMANAYHHLAEVSERLGSSEESLGYSRMALEIREDIGDSRRTVVTRGAMAQALLSLERCEEAWETVETAVHDARKAGYWLEYLGILGTAARAAQMAGREDRAWEMARHGLETALERGTRSSLLSVIATAATLLRDRDMALAAKSAAAVLAQPEIRAGVAEVMEELLERARRDLGYEEVEELQRVASRDGLTPLLQALRDRDSPR